MQGSKKKKHSCSIAVLRVCVLVVTPSALKPLSPVFSVVFILLPDSGLQGLAKLLQYLGRGHNLCAKPGPATHPQ